MANEVRMRLQVSVDKGDVEGDFDETRLYDMATGRVEDGSQTVGTTHEAIRLGDIAAPQDMILLNLDADNYVEIGIDQTGSFVPIAKIRPRRMAVIPPASGVTLYAKANTAAVELRRFIPET